MAHKIVGAVAALALLGGCAYDIDEMRTVQPVGSPFTKALTEEYREIVAFEADEMYDWIDASYFAAKGLMAAQGEEVPPELVSDWSIADPEARQELITGRQRLEGVFDQGARERFPAIAAHAQGRYDCWIEQQEEGWQTDDIAACRDGFYAAMTELDALLGTPAAGPSPYTIFFAWDSDVVSPAGMVAVDNAIAAASKMGLSEYAVTGYTDTSGSAAYNLQLSLRRANSVKSALVARGVPDANISVAGRGESDLAVPTPDGVREQANRRAVILIQ
ncbi:MAG: OmpA family protein [Pseudomonadota bacterium]